LTKGTAWGRRGLPESGGGLLDTKCGGGLLSKAAAGNRWLLAKYSGPLLRRLLLLLLLLLLRRGSRFAEYATPTTASAGLWPVAGGERGDVGVGHGAELGSSWRASVPLDVLQREVAKRCASVSPGRRRIHGGFGRAPVRVR
jgi:hypothetical protein